MVKLLFYIDKTPKKNEKWSRGSFQVQCLKSGPNKKAQAIKQTNFIISIINNTWFNFKNDKWNIDWDNNVSIK